MSNVSMIDGHIDEPKKITRFEKIKRDLTIERVAKYLYNHCEGYCFEMCKKKTGNITQCPHEDKVARPCFDCAIEYLSEEVKDDE